MNGDPCEAEKNEIQKAGENYVLWEKRATLPPSLTPIDEQKQPIVLTPNLLKQLRESREKAKAAKEKWIKALDDLADCVRRNK